MGTGPLRAPLPTVVAGAWPQIFELGGKNLRGHKEAVWSSRNIELLMLPVLGGSGSSFPAQRADCVWPHGHCHSEVGNRSLEGKAETLLVHDFSHGFYRIFSPPPLSFKYVRTGEMSRHAASRGAGAGSWVRPSLALGKRRW